MAQLDETLSYLVVSFRQLFPNATTITVRPDGESYIARVDSVTYTCEFGSDDDCFEFVRNGGDPFIYPMFVCIDFQ